MRHTLRWLANESRREVDPTPWLTELFDHQREFVSNPAKRKCALCSRRAGKTKANAAGLIDALVRHPEAIALYLTLTAGISYDMLWAELTEANQRFNLGLVPSVSDNRFIHPKGGCIWLAGCKDIREAEKYRGFRYSLVIIDEGGTHKTDTLKYLVENVLSAATTDFGAPIWLTGTPGVIPRGYFWGLTEGQDPDIKPWATHRWSVRDNPHHPFGRDPEALERYRVEELGLPADHPTWLREGLGQWALDDSKLVYPFDANKNGWDGVLPVGPKRTILGMDIGDKSPTTFVVTTSVEGVIYVRRAFGKPRMFLNEIADTIKQLQHEYPEMREIYVDHGGLGGKLMAQLQQDYGLPVQMADKAGKAANIMRVQTALHSRKLKVHQAACRELLDEWVVLPWNDDHDDHRDGFADHCSDGLLYAFRKHPIKDPLVQQLGPESLDQFNARIRSSMIQSSQRKRNHRGW